MQSFTAASLSFLKRTLSIRSPKPSRKSPAKSPQVVDWEDTVDGLIIRHLLRELAHMRRDGNRASHWVIGPEWWQDILRLTDPDGNELYANPYRASRAGYLYGVPVQVQPWATFPVLVPVR